MQPKCRKPSPRQLKENSHTELGNKNEHNKFSFVKTEYILIQKYFYTFRKIQRKIVFKIIPVAGEMAQG